MNQHDEEYEGGETEGEEAQGQADFCFGPNGMIIDAEESPVPGPGEPLKASFEVINIGTAPGACQVDIASDGTIVTTWTSHEMAVGEQAIPSADGYHYGIPPVSEGEHRFEAWATPGETEAAYTSNTMSF